MLLHERYRLIKQIGKGGCCKTFLATDEAQSLPVLCVVQQLQQQEQTAEEFIKKAQQLGELGKHPQIPALIAYFVEKQHFYLVQEYIEGKNLATLVEEQGSFSETQIWQLLENVLPVLKFTRDRHIIHCDIKPENLILRPPPSSPLSRGGAIGSPDETSFTSLDESVFLPQLPLPPHLPLLFQVRGDLILVDFGTAKFLSERKQVRNERSIGSPEYAAPEQTQGKPVFASDLYSLGVTCIYLLTQISPFDLFDTTSNSWVWRQYLNTKISDRLGKIIDKLIANSKSDRFQSADEVMQAMGIQSPIPHLKSQIQNWHCLHTLAAHPNFLSGVNSIAISLSSSLIHEGEYGEILASAHDDKTTKLWDLNTKKLICTLTGHDQAVKSVAFSPDGKILATAGDDKKIKLWNLNTREQIFTLTGHTNSVKSVAFSFDGTILASGSWDKTVKLWNVKTGEEICTLVGHQLQVSAVAFSPQSQLLASASYDRTIRLWDISSFNSPRLDKEKFKNCPLYSLSSHTWAVLTLSFSPDGKILATGSDDNTIKFWDINTGQVIRTLQDHSWSVLAITFSANGETLISGSRDNTIKIWRVSTGEEIATLTGHEDSVSAVAVSPVAQLIVSGSRDKTIKLWELGQQQLNSFGNI
ncbi:serine/threonine-protein kinase [Chlorogloeopsis sp. ULAP01]|uniref:serine/threonine-protein kinase n=1 Tax=Chlorogloeopsis sp. ULAP01 TaxID=3056483 RepID=UPI0025AB270B|nr:serine/threonine-protein kinase [Chlorogloeopsis sp. ULAP01]MDM9384963.1 serine/threonine-protein kinase [Chlorogloeopsis sp. ULAP01]